MKATLTLQNGETISVNITEEEVKKMQDKKQVCRWKPEESEIYHYIYSGTVSDTKYVVYDKYDTGRISLGNCYPTKELAQQAMDKKLAIVRVNDAIDIANDGWLPDWEDEEQYKFIINFNQQDGFVSNYYQFYQHAFILGQMKNGEIAKEIIANHLSDLKLIFNIK